MARNKPCMHKRTVKTRRGTKTVIVNKGVPKKTRKRSSFNDKAYAIGIIRNKMDENMALAQRRKRVNDRLDNLRPISVEERFKYNEELDASLRKSRDNLERIKFLGKKYNIK